MIEGLYDFAKEWSKTGSVWLYSDPHFEDEEQRLMCPNWISDEEQIQRLRERCHKFDTLVILGDIGEPRWVKELNCRLVVVLGNHDRGKENYRGWFHEVYNGPLFISDKILLSHEPVDLPFCFNFHGHCHGGTRMDERHMNLAADVTNFTPVSLGSVIKTGILKNIPSIHRIAIEKQKRKSG